jgi:hypothetical protein
MWVAAFMAAAVAITVAIGALTLGGEETRQATAAGIATTVVSGTAVNTPSELSGGVVGGPVQATVTGTAANTPTELSGGLGGFIEPAAPEPLRAAERYDLHQRI